MTRVLESTESLPLIAPPGSGPRRLRNLSVVHSTSGHDRSIPLDPGPIILGRDPGPGGVCLDDRRASRRHVQLTYAEAFDVYRLRDLGSKNGTFINGKQVTDEHLMPDSVIRIGDTLLVYAEVEAVPGCSGFEPPPGRSLALERAEYLADLAAPTEHPMLILGATGVGKERIAERIHEASGRSGPLVAVNCATFSRELIGSELFGHVRGAYSGAASPREGVFRAADRGTLFLDEIAELPLDQQPALLRALQERRIRPVGADREIAVDVRIVAATHHDPKDLLDRGSMRPDLYGRLAAIVVHLPGLQHRRSEILPIFCQLMGDDAPQLTADAAEAMLTYDWPLNIRELQHAAAGVKLYAHALERLEVSFLPSAVQQAYGQGDSIRPRRDLGREELEQMLVEHKGNISKLADVLGQSRQRTYRLLAARDIDLDTYRKR